MVQTAEGVTLSVRRAASKGVARFFSFHGKFLNINLVVLAVSCVRVRIITVCYIEMKL